MPMNKSLYPSDWKEISLRVREEAGWRCEQCGVANGAYGARDKYGEWHTEHEIDHMNSDLGWSLWPDGYPDMIRIVLTVAHLDHDTQNNERSNLKALCQKCHLNHDRPLHQARAAATRHRKREAAEAARLAAIGQQAMSLDLGGV